MATGRVTHIRHICHEEGSLKHFSQRPSSPTSLFGCTYGARRLGGGTEGAGVSPGTPDPVQVESCAVVHRRPNEVKLMSIRQWQPDH